MRTVQVFNVFPHVFIIISLSTTGAVMGHSCYICGGSETTSNQQLERIFPSTTFPPCEDGRVIRQCPTEFKGCLTQNNGTRVTKTCGYLAMNTCKTANRVEYCYCQGDLCNGDSATLNQQQPLPPPTRSSSSTTTNNEDDEEDDEEDVREGSAAGPYSNRGRVATASGGSTDDFETLVHPLPPPTSSDGHSATTSVHLSSRSLTNDLTRFLFISVLLMVHYNNYKNSM